MAAAPTRHVYPLTQPAQGEVNLWLHFKVQKNTRNPNTGQDGIGDVISEFFLPAPQNLVEGNSHNWETVAKGIAGALTNPFTQVQTDAYGFGDFFEDVGGGLVNLYNALSLPAFNALGVQEFARSSDNPRNELRYSSPALRTWNFSWQFANQNVEDANAIITLMKQFSYPVWHSQSRMTFPCEFFITVVAGDGNATAMKKIISVGKSVLVNMNINQTGAGQLVQFGSDESQDMSSPALIPDAASPFVNLDMSFQEVQARRAASTVLGGGF